ncbi:hypothetical protein ACA910_016421 [Epithemia clementina (nom. ined.)]
MERLMATVSRSDNNSRTAVGSNTLGASAVLSAAPLAADGVTVERQVQQQHSRHKSKPIRILVRDSPNLNSDVVEENEEKKAQGNEPCGDTSIINRASSSLATLDSSNVKHHPKTEGGHQQRNFPNSKDERHSHHINRQPPPSSQAAVGVSYKKLNSKKSRKPRLDTVQLIDLAPELSVATGVSKHYPPQPHSLKEKNESEKKSNTRPSSVSGVAQQTDTPTRNGPWRAPPKQPPQNSKPTKGPTSATNTNLQGVTLNLEDFPSLPRDNGGGIGQLNPLARPWTGGTADRPTISIQSTASHALTTNQSTLSDAKTTWPITAQQAVPSCPPSRHPKAKNNGATKNENGTGGTITQTTVSKKAEALGKIKAEEPKASKKDNGSKKAHPKSGLSVVDLFAAKQRSVDTADRDMAGDELQLVRLMMEGKVASANKGHGHRQRIRPRKKKFSTLKKHVLKERLIKWQRLNPQNDKAPEATDADSEITKDNSPVKFVSTTICIFGFAESELLEDDDEFDELISNLRDMAEEIAPYKSVFIPRETTHLTIASSLSAGSQLYPAFVNFLDIRGFDAAMSCWNGLTMGGQQLTVDRVDINFEECDDPDRTSRWEKQCVEWFNERRSNTSSQQEQPCSAQIILEDVLTEDDLEDEECLEESLNDIRKMAEKYGSVCVVQANKALKSVTVIFQDSASSSDAAKLAAENLAKTVVGGSTIVARIQQPEEKCQILLKNIFSDEDLDDDDCLEESMDDLRELAGKYGQVLSVEVVEGTSSAKVVFLGSEKVAQSAASGFQGLVVGGAAIEVVVLRGDEVDTPESSALSTDKNATKNVDLVGSHHPSAATPEQLYSGDKLIGESWAECKRVPKVPNGSNPRPYATLVDDETTKPLLIELLGELMRLQKRAVEEDKNTKIKRRLVLGLREVARGIRTKKVKMVVMANNLDEYGVIDEKLQEILDLAYQESIPVFFELSKRALGKALGKTIKIAVVGIQNPEGAYQTFKKLLKLQPSYIRRV